MGRRRRLPASDGTSPISDVLHIDSLRHRRGCGCGDGSGVRGVRFGRPHEWGDDGACRPRTGLLRSLMSFTLTPSGTDVDADAETAPASEVSDSAARMNGATTAPAGLGRDFSDL